MFFFIFTNIFLSTCFPEDIDLESFGKKKKKKKTKEALNLEDLEGALPEDVSLFFNFIF